MGEHRLLVGDRRRQLGSEPGNLHRCVSLGGGGEVGEPVVDLLRRQLPSLARVDVVPQFLAQGLELEAPLGARLEVCRQRRVTFGVHAFFLGGGDGSLLGGLLELGDPPGDPGVARGLPRRVLRAGFAQCLHLAFQSDAFLVPGRLHARRIGSVLFPGIREGRLDRSEALVGLLRGVGAFRGRLDSRFQRSRFLLELGQL
mmetsp:Transcript_11955/g.51478  ORF Transcript_11955/g.51478 Transcript_11955/m.51478 type:complete len:200 (+) Transcript_11955:3676-4275(+)